MQTYSDQLIKSIIREAGTDWDFELFCCRHYSQIEGFTYVPTSRNYDVGADGRKVEKRIGGESYIIASRQKVRLIAKVKDDVKKLKDGGRRAAKIRVCFAYAETEKELLAIEKAARKIMPKVEIEVTGLLQIVDEVKRRTDAFDDIYEQPIELSRQQLESPRTVNQQSERLGLRVLLATQLNEDGEQLRNRILRGLVLQCTAFQGQTRSLQAIARSVADAIGLEQPVVQPYLQPIVDTLVAEGILDRSVQHEYTQRMAISTELVIAGDAAATKLIKGYGAVKRALAESLSFEITTPAYRRIWEKVQSGLVELFRRYGAEYVTFIHRVTSLASGATMPTTPEGILQGLRRIAESVNGIEKLDLNPKQREELIALLPKVLLDPESGAREWLIQLCLGFIGACSLGLHPNALAQLRDRIKTWDVIPDTHVILSLFGEGEEDHEVIRQLLTWWVEANGTLIAAEPVMREVTNHAKRADEIYVSWAERCHRSQRHPPPLPANNVFLRSLIARHGECVAASVVSTYIFRFAVPRSTSTDRVEAVLKDDHRFKLASSPPTDLKLIARLEKAIKGVRTLEADDGEFGPAAKCTIDARLLAFLAAHRAANRNQGGSRTAVILTQAHFLSRVTDDFVDVFGVHPTCIDAGRLLCALSMSKATGFSMRSVEAALFGREFQKEVRKHEAIAKRVVDELAKLSAEDSPAYMREVVNVQLTRS